MSWKAASMRFVCGFGGGLLALAAWLWIVPGWLGAGVAVALFLVTSAVSERLWRRHAALSDIRADLEDRTRNEPA
jgi:hypothetical protein